MAQNFKIVGTVSHTKTLEDLLSTPEKLACCDVVELRFDQYMDKQKSLELCQNIRKFKEVLLTIRTDREGGTWEIDDESRFDLFQFFAPHVDMVDIELKSELFSTHCRKDFPPDIQVIASFHNYEITPDDSEIAELIQLGRSWKADIIKLALFSNTGEDVDRLRKFLSEKNICLIGMSEVGLVTRTEFPLEGSCLTYGFLDNSAAPGQVSARELSELLR